MSEKEIQLFFHPDSKACIKLRDIVSESNKNENIKYINIDNLKIIPSNIKSVPPLIINDDKILTGKSVFDYFTKEDDEFEFVGFQGKSNNLISNFYSNIDDDNNSNIDSASFSGLDTPTMNNGVPDFEDAETKALKLEDITSRRALLEKELGLNDKKSNKQ